MHASVMLPRGNSNARGKVVACKRNANGNPIGQANENPILDLHVHHVEFDNGDVSKLTVNVIGKAMYASCDEDGNEYLMMHLLVNHKSNAQAESKEDQRIVHRGCNSMCHSTVGWHLCIQWKDGNLLAVPQRHEGGVPHRGRRVRRRTGHQQQTSLQLVGKPCVAQAQAHHHSSQEAKCAIPEEDAQIWH